MTVFFTRAKNINGLILNVLFFFCFFFCSSTTLRFARKKTFEFVSNPSTPSFFIPEGFIVFSMLDNFSGYRQIFKMDINRENLKQLYFTPYDIKDVCISPNGKYVACDFNATFNYHKVLQIYNIELNRIEFYGRNDFFSLRGWDIFSENILMSSGYFASIFNIESQTQHNFTVFGKLQFYKYHNSIALSRFYPEIEKSRVLYFTLSKNDTTLITDIPDNSYMHHFCWKNGMVVGVISPWTKPEIIIYDFVSKKTMRRFPFYLRDYGPKWTNDGNYFSIVGWSEDEWKKKNLSGTNSPSIYIFTKEGNLVIYYCPGEDILGADIHFY